MANNDLWEQLLNPKNLKRGWHLSRSDMRADFVEELLAVEIFASNLDNNITELRNRLSTDTYQPKPLLRIEVPKGTLGIRPGSVIAIEDRIILYTIIYLISPRIDRELPKTVYSYRLKDNIKSGDGSLFKESDIGDLLDMPFLKKKTISTELDPFDPWYANWPEFDQQSRFAFEKEGFRFLAVSDIAAYFENIQLPILRDLLLEYFPQDHKIINLLVHFLETWTVKTDSGRLQLRGIPQGNAISSFLGNVFLLPLDKEFEKFSESNEIAYFRYMDDVRIFSKDAKTARQTIFLMDKTLRALHLNVQSAKTKILEGKEIDAVLVDERVEKLTAICDEIRKAQSQENQLSTMRNSFKKQINDIAKESPSNLEDGQRILGARKPLKGLSLRAFQRWINAQMMVGSSDFLERLVEESFHNPDHRLTKRVTAATKKFPRKCAVGKKLLEFIQSDFNIFPHQEAEFIRACRYMARIDSELINHCYTRLLDSNQHYYVRMQSAYLLGRTELDIRQLSISLQLAFDSETNHHVQVAIARLLIQNRRDSAQIVRRLMLHPNDKIRSMGMYFRELRNEAEPAQNAINFILNPQIHWRLCDHMPSLYAMLSAPDETIRFNLLKALEPIKSKTPIWDLRPILERMYQTCLASITTPSSNSEQNPIESQEIVVPTEEMG